MSKNVEHEKKALLKKTGKGKIDLSKIALNLEEISYTTYFFSLLANVRLKNSIFYNHFKQYLCKLSGFIGD